MTLREVAVARAIDVTPGMRRVTLVGAQLEAFTAADGSSQPPFDSTGFDDDIRLLFPYPGETEPVLPAQNGRTLDHPRDPRPLSKVYTVRRWNPETRELDIDFVKHGIGIATTWAYRAQPGDRIHFFGPSVSRALPQDADWLLVAGDDTALPAIARLLEELPDDARAQVFIEVAEDPHRQDLRPVVERAQRDETSHIEITWLSRNGAAAGTTTLLRDAVKVADWWEGRPFAWVAGEHSAVRDLRRHLVEDRGMPKADIEFTGYWRRGEAVASETDAAVPDLEKTVHPYTRAHDLTELVPPLAIRTAIELSVFDLISRGVTSVSDLATRSGSDERALGKLLRYLRTLDILKQSEPGRYQLAPVGEVLTNEFLVDALHPEGISGRGTLGLFGLTESIRTGQSAYASVTGRSFAEIEADPVHVAELLERSARFADHLAPALAELPALAAATQIVVRSKGANSEAREITAANPNAHVTIAAPPAHVEWLRRDLPDSVPDAAQRDRISIVESAPTDPAPAADVALLVYAIGALDDITAAEALRAAAVNLAPTGRVLLVEHTFDTDDLDEHDG
ncbi:siderophore-interacting protein [Microbacterium sp.]|uniref:siderophore-interacting protein n=1 Tax=Microbacterium sp. TaxID=51671 RepID=UPI003C73D93E